MPEPLSKDDQSLLDFVADRDVACPACKYNLRALTSPSCPECGNTLRLSVGVADGINSAWITALVATLLPAGLGVPTSIIMLIGLSHDASLLVDMASDPAGFGLMLLFTYLALCIPLGIFLLAKRAWFIRLKRETQYSIAGIIITLDVIAIIEVIAFFAKL